MDKTNYAKTIIEEYNVGKRYFVDLDLYEESFDGENLEGIIFDHCFLYSSFRKTNLRNSKFINGNIKTCDFSEADLTNSHFENVSIESAHFKDSITDGIFFDNNWCYGKLIKQVDFNSIKNEIP